MQKQNQDPTARDFYSKAKFWDDRYVQKGGFFDWYAEYPELKYAFESQYGMTKQDHILMVGCGNSKLSQQMYEAGYKDIYNIDISPVVIQQMAQVSPAMQWLVMDATAMTFQDKKFDYVIDKGTMDALIAGRDLTPTIKLLQQCTRVTKQQGQVILITYGSPEGRKKIFQSSLPFHLFDYYFAYVNLNDMSTMINLMRNNTIGPNGQSIDKAQALQRSMKQFMMIKIMRKKRSKDKQFVIWQNFMKKTESLPTKGVQKQVQAPMQQEKEDISQQKVSTKLEKQQVFIKDNKSDGQNTSNIKYLSKPQKQSYVYAYSIKRKFGYDFNPSQKLTHQIKQCYDGKGNQTKFKIRGSTTVNEAIGRCIDFFQRKQIAYSTATFLNKNQSFSKNSQSIQINIQNGAGVDLNVLTKTNIDLRISFSDMNQLTTTIAKLGDYLVQKIGLPFHPCPKTYSLFTMIKGRMKAKTANELLKKYWYPTIIFLNVNVSKNEAEAVLSIPPVLPYILQDVKAQISVFFQKQTNIKTTILETRNGFVTFPQLNLFGFLNMASLSYNAGKNLNVKMTDFWKGENNFEKEDQSNLYIVHQSHVQVSQSLLPFVLLYILALY